MVLTTCADLAELAKIPRIDPDKVKLYGAQILKLVRDTQRRYAELTKDRDDADGVVPDPNHKNVINLTSDDEEYDDEDVFDQALEMEETPHQIASRYFSTQPILGDSDEDDGDGGPSKGRGSKSRKRPAARKPRKNSTASRPRAKSARPRKKQGDRSESRTNVRKASKPASTSTIGMMPI